MLPDFSKPAFSLVALCTIQFQSKNKGESVGTFRSDYRCQLHFLDEEDENIDVEVRIYFVGYESVSTSNDIPAILAFLDWESQRTHCNIGRRFELREGRVVTATGIVHALATR